MFNKQNAIDWIDKNKQTFIDLSDKIWEYAELSLKEFKSAKLYCEVLKKLGFEVEEKVCGIDTAFLGKFGNGRPYIGILGEFDALSGLSQVGGTTEKEPIVQNGNGHGCGHNMLGAGSLAAAYGIKKYLEETKQSGTVIFYGTPGEEGGAGKAFMAKEGLFYDLDFALTWHPGDYNETVTGTCNSCIQTLYKFKGISAHAAGDPEDGRSALDAVELMNVGVQFLREHMKTDARIHYSIIDGGGASPNVVQPTASVLYMVRSCLVKDALELQERVDNIAKGAAMMTDTTVEKVFIDGCSNTVPNHTLEDVLYKNFEEIGVQSYSNEEIEYAQSVKSTYKNFGIPELYKKIYNEKEIQFISEKSENGMKPLNDFLVPQYKGDLFTPGSTDVGDVSWQTPTAQINALCFVSGAPGHSWQNVSCGKTTIGHKGLIMAGKVICGAAIDLLQNQDLIMKAKEEYKIKAKDGYVCPIPKEEKAKAIEI